VNFIGVGDPARAAAMGSSILDVTREWDDRILRYLRSAPETRYVFMSSGAVYGHVFDAPVTAQTNAVFPVNSLGPSDWYSLAKLHAEAMHRVADGFTIVDLRIFNYVSRSLDPDARFLISDMIRAIRNRTTIETRSEPISRDYLEPAGLHAILQACLAAPLGTNRPVDAYTRAPVLKADLLEHMAREFGLSYAVGEGGGMSSPTGWKPHYYSTNKAAAELGYSPLLSSWEGIRKEVQASLDGS
jgi:nucleoside-diphosphate-sugar epimerase